MGMFSDFFRYFYAVIRGERDPLVSYTEPLTLAERYLRWGRQNDDLRDFHAGLEQLRLCLDADAPLPVLLIRKYACLIDLVQGGVDSLLAQYENLRTEDEHRERDVRFERDNVAIAWAEAKAAVTRLKAEGSVLRAREQERLVGELQTRLETLEASLQDIAERSDLCESYDRTVADCERFFQYLDQAQLTVSLAMRLDEEARNTITRQIGERLEQNRARMNALDPIKTPAPGD